MTESGKVISTDGEYAVVRIERRSACASCGKCGMTEGQKHADIRVKNKCSAAVGEYAEISMGDRAIFLSSAIVYLIPLLGAAVGLIVGNFLKNDLIQIILCFAGLILGYTIVSIIGKILNKNKNFTPVMLAKYQLPPELEEKLEEEKKE